MKHLSRYPRNPDTEVAWDIEAREWSKVRMICAVGSDGKRIVASGFPELERKARAHNWLRSGVRWWAHWGGIYDHVLLLEKCLPRWRMLRGAYSSGQGVWSLDLALNHERWNLRDSARIMTDSLANVGKAFGLAKLDVDRSRIEELSDAECEHYCLRDCEIVLLALDRFAKVWAEHGGSMRDTLASTSATFLRKTEIPPDAWGWNPETDARVAPAYYGGRVERFRTELEDCAYYDINSSYPFEMAKPLPTRLCNVGFGKPPRKRGTVSIVRARVKVPEHLYVAPLPHRPAAGALKGRLVFPVGTLEGMWCDDELAAAEDACGVHVEPLQFWQYDTEPYLATFVERWYRIKKETTDPAMRYIAKLAMNSVSGKLIERGEYESFSQSPVQVLKAMEAAERGGGLAPRRYSIRTLEGLSEIWTLAEKHNGPLRHAAAAAVVLGRARGNLLRAMVDCGQGNLGYCDTDSVIRRGAMPTGAELGEWKLEKELDRAEFLAPKVYALWPAGGAPLDICAKGFRVRPVERDETPDTLGTGKGKATRGDQYRLANGKLVDRENLWRAMADGDGVVFQSTRGFKSAVRLGDIRFARIEQTRSLHPGIDKRCFDGVDSRPWNVDELPGLR